MEDGRDDPMDIDLNLEPSNNPSSSSSSIAQIEPIDERIRRLEQITIRSRHRWRRLRQQHTPIPQEPITIGEGSVSRAEERSNQRCNTCGGRATDLIANALKKTDEDDDDEKEKEKASDSDRSAASGFFDCNVCFDMASDPVLTSCGHLFCWECLYQWLHLHSQAKECPVCKGEVSDTQITPIYGRGTDSAKEKKKEEVGKGLKIPPRPKAQRIESSRQVSRRIESSFSIQELIQRIGSTSRVLTIREEGSDGPSSSDQSRQTVIVDSSLPNPGRSHSSRRLLRSSSRGLGLTIPTSTDGLVENYFHETQTQFAPDRENVARTQGSSMNVDSIVSLSSSDGSRVSDMESGRRPTRRRRR